MKAASPEIRLLSALVCALILAGCSSAKPPLVSDRERTESFRAYCNSTVGGQPLSVFLQNRTAMLLSGMTVDAADFDHQIVTLAFHGDSFVTAQAIAITTDGYFLTAAHCVNSPSNYLVFLDGQAAKIAVPRVVARITDPTRRRDLAVLHVDARLTEVFTWAGTDTIRSGTPTVAVGSSQVKVVDAEHATVGRICFGGRITSAKKLAAGGVMVLSNLPGRAGDSGGPLLGVDGTLIGVHIGMFTSLTTHPKAVAFHPDPSWVARVIEEDRLNPSPDSKKLLPRLAGGNGDPVIKISLGQNADK